MNNSTVLFCLQSICSQLCVFIQRPGCFPSDMCFSEGVHSETSDNSGSEHSEDPAAGPRSGRRASSEVFLLGTRFWVHPALLGREGGWGGCPQPLPLPYRVLLSGLWQAVPRRGRGELNRFKIDFLFCLIYLFRFFFLISLISIVFHLDTNKITYCEYECFNMKIPTIN